MFFSTSRVDTASLPLVTTAFKLYLPLVRSWTKQFGNTLWGVIGTPSPTCFSNQPKGKTLSLLQNPKPQRFSNVSKIIKVISARKYPNNPNLTYIQIKEGDLVWPTCKTPFLGFPDWMSPTSAKMLSKSASVTQPPALFKYGNAAMATLT